MPDLAGWLDVSQTVASDIVKRRNVETCRIAHHYRLHMICTAARTRSIAWPATAPRCREVQVKSISQRGVFRWRRPARWCRLRPCRRLSNLRSGLGAGPVIPQDSVQFPTDRAFAAQRSRRRHDSYRVPPTRLWRPVPTATLSGRALNRDALCSVRHRDQIGSTLTEVALG